jgi:hypothetical protein
MQPAVSRSKISRNFYGIILCLHPFGKTNKMKKILFISLFALACSFAQAQVKKSEKAAPQKPKEPPTVVMEKFEAPPKPPKQPRTVKNRNQPPKVVIEKLVPPPPPKVKEVTPEVPANPPHVVRKEIPPPPPPKKNRD